MSDVEDRTPGLARLLVVLERIDRRLEGVDRRLDQIERHVDEFAGAYLNAKFPYGRGTDRWAGRRRGGA
jgi:hypothetical protein